MRNPAFAKKGTERTEKLKAFERNRDGRKRSARKRLALSFAAALLLHFFLLLVAGLWTLAPGKDAKEELFLEIAEFIPSEEDKPDAPVENPRKFSERSYRSEEDKLKFGIAGSPPSSSSFFSAGKGAAGAPRKDVSLSGNFVRRLIRDAGEQSLGDLYRESERRIGNDGDYRGEDADESDFSVKEFKHYSYWIKLKRKIENVWRPASGRVPRTGADIHANVRIVIARDGRLELARIVTPSGFPRFDSEAIRAVRTASPYSPFPKSWEDDRIDTVIRFIMVDFSWKRVLIQS